MSEKPTPPKGFGLRFNPSFSIDGVGALLAVVLLVVWLAKLDQRVSNNTINVERNSVQVEKLNEAVIKLTIIAETQSRAVVTTQKK